MSDSLKRRIFFWILSILFFITTTLVVFYALGYRFSFERGIFIYAGSITVKSNPRNINIALNGNPVPSKKVNYLNNSYHIDGIKPGEYSLEVSASGFQSWSKKINIHSGISTEFWNVLLTRVEYPKTDLFVSSDKRFFLSPKNNYIAYIRSRDNESSVNILDLDSSESERIFSSGDFEFAKNDKDNIDWSPQSHAVIIPAVRKDSRMKNYFIVNIDSKNAVNLKDISGFENPEHIRWDPQKKNILYFLSDKNLYRMDIENPDGKKLIGENISAFDFASGSIFYFQLPGGIVYKINPAGEGSPKQITTSPPDDLSDKRYNIIVYDEDRIVFINDYNHNLYIRNKGEKDEYFNKLSRDAQGVQFSNDGKKLLFWNDWEIFAYFTRDWDVQPARLENETLDITRFSENLKNVQWAKDYEHILFTAGKYIKIAELDRRDRCNIMDVYALESNNGFMVSSFSDNKVYFTGKTGENSSTFNLFGIDFPEKEGILGL